MLDYKISMIKISLFMENLVCLHTTRWRNFKLLLFSCDKFLLINRMMYNILNSLFFLWLLSWQKLNWREEYLRKPQVTSGMHWERSLAKRVWGWLSHSTTPQFQFGLCIFDRNNWKGEVFVYCRKCENLPSLSESWPRRLELKSQ